jgi:hypothetical protein
LYEFELYEFEYDFRTTEIEEEAEEEIDGSIVHQRWESSSPISCICRPVAFRL